MTIELITMKKRIRSGFFTVILITVIIQSCFQADNKTVHGDWIKGSEEEKIKTIEKQFRGFDNAMVETGYRYQELYWAGQDENWEYAKYQLEKIKVAIENGLERRPKRAKSAEHFLTYTLPEMLKAVESKDTSVFNKNFQILRTACKSCHIKEDVPFIQSAIPRVRISPIKFQKDN
jgi:CRISPR/Cas system CSM-associated protein Csm2 small subunit